MSYWRKCLSTGDYQYIATGEPAPEDIVVPWWEVELARKDKRIDELENLLLLSEENRLFHRANVEKSTDGSLNICWGEHEKWEDCEYVRYYPEQRIAESPPVAGSETEPDFTGRVAELEAALKLAMDWLEDDVPKYIVDKLINSLR